MRNYFICFLWQDTIGSSSLRFRRVLEVTVHNHKDVFDGVLVLYEAAGEGGGGEEPLHIETLVRPASSPSPIFSADSDDAHFSVGTDFDPKELLFRNKFGALGPDSPALAVICRRKPDGQKEGEEMAFTLAVFDPRGKVAAVEDIK